MRNEIRVNRMKAGELYRRPESCGKGAPFHLQATIFFMLVSLAFAVPARARDINVGPSESLTAIQAGVDAAISGDTIRVLAGSYTENVTIPAGMVGLNLRGSVDGLTVVSAADPNKNVLTVNAPHVTIDFMTFQGATGTGQAGISANNASDFHIADSFVQNNDIGLDLNGTSRSTIWNNVFVSNRVGIGLTGSDGNFVRGNLVFNAGDVGVNLVDSSQNILINNTVTDGTQHGLKLMASHANKVLSNDFMNNLGFGLSIDSSNNNNIYVNNFGSNASGDVDSNSANNWNSQRWRSYSYFGSRYESYVGNNWGGDPNVDSDGDGVVESPHTLPDSEPPDSYPLAMPFFNYMPTVDSAGDFSANGTWFHKDFVGWGKISSANPTGRMISWGGESGSALC